MPAQYSFSTPVSTPQIVRELQQRDQRQKLIHSLRSAAFHASLVAHDTTGLSDRCRLAELITTIDAVLRSICNGPGVAR